MKLPPKDEWIPDRFARLATATDSETHKIQEGLLAPPPVCGSIASLDGSVYSRLVLPPEVWLDTLERLLDSDRIIVGANIAYDLGVACAARPRLVKKVFAKLERGDVFDVLVQQTLDWISLGLLGGENDDHLRLPEGGKVLGPNGKFAKRFSLDLTTLLVHGRKSKVRDFWRMRYALLEQLPIELWPEDAREYPKDDAQDTLENALAQVGTIPRGASGTIRPARNLHNHTLQTRAAWAYQLGSIWGVRTDPERVEAFEKRVEAQHVADSAAFEQHGLIRGPQHPQCLSKPGKRAGTFLKPEYEVGTVDQQEVKRRVARAYGAVDERKCPACQGSGKARSEKTGAPVQCKTCDATGMDIPAAVPRTPAGAISKERDTLKECDDDVLDAFADVSNNEKLRKTYLPFMKLGTTRPINLGANILLSSGRASYYGLIQLLPRAGGVRECFVPGVGWLLVSIDYSGVEMVTLAQSQIFLRCHSPLADALLKGDDAHCRLAARMVGESYESFLAAYKGGSKKHKSYRQAAKPGNFGYGGGMGAAKFVLTQRKAADTTFGPDGTEYKGIRFCLILGRAERCGVKKITEWNDRECAPVCSICVDAAEELRQAFVDTWVMRPYFTAVKNMIDRNNKEILIPPLNRVRGGCSFTQAANGFFQGLAADMMKHAYWEVSKEAYTDEESPMFGARVPSCIHDELLATVRAEGAHEAAFRMTDVMVEAGRLFLPDLAPALKAVPALMNRWWKSAEDIYDENGRLTAWDAGVVAYNAKGQKLRVRDDASGAELLPA